MKEETKTTKKRRILRLSLQVTLFFAVVFTLYLQLKNVDWNAFGKIEIKSWLALIMALLLLVLNQGIEYLKWQVFTVHLIDDKRKTWNSFLAGLASGFLSPNGWGNVVGRMLYFSKRNSVLVVLVTALGNLSQLIPTVLFGCVALFFSGKLSVLWLIAALIVLLCLITVYYFGELVFGKRKLRNRTLRHLRLMLDRFGYLRNRLLFLSLVRFIVFTVQFVLLFIAFGYTDFWLITSSVWLIYLLTSFIPSLWSGKILIRETAALFVFKNTIVSSEVDIIIICLLIWFINIAIPSLIGSFVLIPLKKKST